MKLFAWPAATQFGRSLSKSRIYQEAGADTGLKARFVQDVEQLVWACKLAPETLNLAATAEVREIQVIRIELRQASVDHAILRAIDRAIPFPLIFELSHAGRSKLAAAWKRPNAADASRWVLGSYFESPWLAEEAERQPLPLVTDMAALYEQLLTALLPQPVGTAVAEPASLYSATPPAGRLPLQQRMALVEGIAAKGREIERIKARLARETQFNKRVAINRELRAAKLELQHLQQQATATND